MYSVLIVDDEDLIRQGLVNMVYWDKLPIYLAGTAIDGLDAYEQIQKNVPDIIITDIRMPEIDGLELIKRVRALNLNITFILFTGYSEFKYAQEAMQYGVKYYLLKPSTEDQLHKVLLEVINEKSSDLSAKETQKNIISKYESLKESSKEHFFKDFLIGKSYGKTAWRHYSKLSDFELCSPSGFLVYFQLCSPHELIHLFALQNITNEIIGSEYILLETKFESNFIILIDESYNNFLYNKLMTVMELFKKYFELSLIIIYRKYSHQNQIPILFSELSKAIDHNYYHIKNKIIKPDTSFPKQYPFSYDLKALLAAVDIFNFNQIEVEIQEYFAKLQQSCFDRNQIKIHIVQLFDYISKHVDINQKSIYLSQLTEVYLTEDLSLIQQLIMDIAKEICENNKLLLTIGSSFSTVVNQLIIQIHESYSDPSLTLKHIASHVLFLNKDYLSKQFNKETGYGFSEYLNYYRMEVAKSILNNYPDMSVSAVAAHVGFGTNSSYFSRSFKKHTGKAPKDFTDSSGK